MVLICVILGILSLIISFVSSSIIPTYIRNLNTEFGAQTYYQLKFTFDSSITDGNGSISVTFPEQVSAGLFPSYLDCYFKQNSSGSHVSVSCDYSLGRIVTLEVGNIVAGEQSLAIGLVKNPIGIYGSSYFKVCVNYNNYQVECNDTFGKVFFDRTPASMISADVQANSSTSSSGGSSWLFSFVLKGIYDQDLYSLRATFPEGFSSTSPYCEVVGSTATEESIVMYDSRIIECQNISRQLKGSQSLYIINMVNPPSAKSLTGFVLEILVQSSGVIVERITFDPSTSINISSGLMKASLSQENYFRLSNSTLTFFANPENLIGTGGAFAIVFVSEWTLFSLNCTLVKGFERETGVKPSCYLNSTSNSYVVDKFKEISLTDQVVIELEAQSPQTVGSFSITLQTLNSQGQTIDQATVVAQTNSTYGSVSRFNAYALKAAVKLNAGQSGPLESTFFLKHALPPTNLLTSGRIIIDIFPNLPKPSLNYGLVKCFFYGDVLASNCDYDDTTNSDRTTITIDTPEDYGYQESEIPITVTTEGAKPGYTDGIPLDPLVKRYLLHYRFFNSTVTGANPIEVYYQEWIPDPFQFSDSDFTSIILVQEANEYTHLRFQFNQQISLPYGDRNYLVRVTFMNTFSDVWEIGQDYDYDYEIIEQYPCLLRGTGIVADPQSLCDLYQQSFRDPFVQAYGFETLQLDLGEIVIFEVPSIKIRSSAVGKTAKVRVSLMEETPGMINHEVELYYKEITFTVLPQSKPLYVYNPSIITTLIPPTVDVLTDLRFSWSSSVFDAEYLIYEINQSFYDIGNGLIPAANCDNNECTKFSKNSQYVVVYPTTPLTESIITNLFQVVQNPNYTGTFIFKVRSMRNGYVTDKYTYNVVISSAQIAISTFDLVATASVQNDINTLIRKNEEHEFYVQFTSMTELPQNSLIRLTFTNILTQVQTTRHVNYCFAYVGLASFDSSEYRCSVISTSIVQFTHFEAIKKGTIIQFRLRLLTTSANSQLPYVAIETFYGPTNTQLVDSAYYVYCSTTMTPTVNSQNKFTVLPEAIRPEKRTKNYIGPVIIDLTQNSLTTIVSVVVTFNTSFKTPRNYGNDSLICLVNEVRFACKYTTAPMIVTIDLTSNTLISSSVYRLSISTEYVSPYDGIVHPSAEGMYDIMIKLTDSSGSQNIATRWLQIIAPKLQYLYIESAIRNAGRANMFFIHFKILYAVQSHSSGGNIQILFPTIDAMGNPMFDLALGGYSKSGDKVGCRFISTGTGIIAPTSSLRCRLIKSESIGTPAAIEIVNFNAMAAGTEVKMWVAKVFNPPNYNNPTQSTPQVMDANIGVTVFYRNPTTGVIKYIHDDYYNVFLDTRDDPVLHNAVHPYSSQASNQVWQSGSQVNSSSKTMLNQVWYDYTPFAAGDYYIVELPSTGSDAMVPGWSMSTCNTFYDWCLTFPQINWIVMHISTSLAINTLYANNDAIIQSLPSSVPQVTTTYNAYVWQGRLFRGYVYHQITPSQWLQLTGTFKNALLIQLDSYKKLVLNEKKVEVNFNVTTTNIVPVGGSIQIIFPTRIPNIYPHCRSSITVGSGLYQSSGQYGNIGCLVQSNSWVITGFQALAAGSNIKVSGIIDLPNDGASGYMGDMGVVTYGTHEDSNIYSTGRIVDKSLSLSGSGLTTTPLSMKFKIGGSSTIVANTGRMRVIFSKYSQLQFQDSRGNPFQFQSTHQYVCGFVVVSTGEKYGCKMESAASASYGLNQDSYTFQMIPNSDLLPAVEYLFVISTINGLGTQEGLIFPNSALPYKVDISFSPALPSSDSDYLLHQHLYYQINGAAFTNLVFTSYITLPTEITTFVIEATFSSIVRTTDVFVIEIPTVSLNSIYALFADDGGLGLQNDDPVPFDIIDMSTAYPNPTLTCKLALGSQSRGLPLKILCSAFLSAGVATDIPSGVTLKIAFNILNPSVPSAIGHLSIPAQVYVQRSYGNAYERTMWDIAENAFYIHKWTPPNVVSVNGDFDLGTALTTVCNVETFLKFRVQNTQNLKQSNGDAYLLRMSLHMRDDDYLHKKTCYYVVGGTILNNCAILPSLYTIIIWPNSANDLLATQIVSTYGNIWWTSPMNDDDATKRVVVGFASYVYNLWTEKIIYQDLYPDVQPQRLTNIDLNILFKPQNLYYYLKERMDLQFEITAPYWYNVDKVVVLFPSASGWLLTGNGNVCVESPGSDIQLTKCELKMVSGQIQIWIDIAFLNTYVKDSATLTQVLKFESHMESFQVPTTATLNLPYNQFSTKFYSWSRDAVDLPAPWNAATPATLNPTTENYVCFSDNGTIKSGQTFPSSPNWDSSFEGDTNIEFDYEYHRYIDEFVPCSNSDRAPIRVEIAVPTAFPDVKGTGNVHTFKFYYGDEIVIPTPVEYQDYVQDKLICYANDDRVECYNDVVNKLIYVAFQQPSVSGVIFFFITAYNTNDITKDGFSYSGVGGQYYWKYELTDSTTSTTYYGYTDPFPVYYNTDNGIVCPHRGLEAASVAKRTTVTSGHMSAFWINIKFARPDILGLTFLFRYKQEDMIQMPGSFSYLNVTSGANYPCSRGLTSGKRNDVRCIFEEGDSNDFTVPVKIHVFDFSYSVGSTETFGFLYHTNSYRIDITIEAYGGTASYDKPYGSLYMGKLSLQMNLVISNYNCASGVGQSICNYIPPAGTDTRMIPTKPAYTTGNILTFQNYCMAGTQGHVLLEIVLQRKSKWDSSYEEVCELDPQYNVDDMFIYEDYDWNSSNPASNEYVKKAYLYYDFSAGQTTSYDVGYFKCRHYRDPIIAYHSCSDDPSTTNYNSARFEYVVHFICEGDTPTTCAPTQTNESRANDNYWNVVNYNNDFDYQIWNENIPNQFTLAMKLTDVNNYFVGTYQSILTFTFINGYMNSGQGIPTYCYVVEGLRMSDTRKLGEEPFCAVMSDPTSATSTRFMFYITNWDTIVPSEYVRVLFNIPTTQTYVGWTSYWYGPNLVVRFNVYANSEAYNNGVNGHMAARSDVTIPTSFMAHTIHNGWRVTSFDVVGADTIMVLEMTNVYGTVVLQTDNYGSSVEYQREFNIALYGLQDYGAYVSSVSWTFGGTLATSAACTNWVITNTKGYVNLHLYWLQDWCIPSGVWSTEVIVFTVTFAGVQVRLDRNYWWTHMRFTEVCINWNGCGYYGSEIRVMNHVWQNTYSVGGVSVTMLSTTENSISEIDFTITSLGTSVGMENPINRILMMEFNGSDWPTNPIYDTSYTLQKIDCLCAFNGATTMTQQTCVRRIRKVVVGRTYDPAIFFYFSATQGTTVRCSIPEIQLGSIGSSTTRTLIFKTIRPSIYEWYGPTATSFNSIYTGTYTFTMTAYSSPTTVSVVQNPSTMYVSRTTTEYFVGYYDLQISGISSLNQPYIYVRHAQIGLIMDASLCIDSSIWDQSSVKVYNLHSKVIICRRQSAITTNAVMGATNLYFEEYKKSGTADYYYNIYVYQSQVWRHTYTSSAIPNANFTPIKASVVEAKNFFYSINISSYTAMFAFEVGLRGFLWKETRDGGRVEIRIPRAYVETSSTVVNITPNCAARIQFAIQYVLYCYVDTRDTTDYVIVIHNLFTKFSTTYPLNVYFFMRNPGTTAAGYRVIQYSSVRLFEDYVSDSDYKVMLEDSYTQTDFDFTEQDTGYTRLEKANARFYGFYYKQFTKDYYELRYYFTFLTQKTYNQLIQFVTNDVCVKSGFSCGLLSVRTKEHLTTVKNRYWDIETAYKGVQYYPGATDYGFVAERMWSPWDQNVFVEIIFSTKGENDHIGLYKTSTNYHVGGMFVYDQDSLCVTLNHSQRGNRYPDDHQSNTRYSDYSTTVQTSELNLQYFMFTNQIHLHPTSFVIGMKFKSACTMDYPRAYIELKFPIITTANIPGASHGSDIDCQISVILEQNPNRVNSARCRTYDISTPSYKGLMVRIEEINEFAAGSILTFAFDDWTLPSSTNGYLAMDIQFNYYVGWSGSLSSEYKRYYLLLKEMILINGRTTSNWSNTSVGTTQLSAPNSYAYGQTSVEYAPTTISTWSFASVHYNPVYGTTNMAGYKMRLVFNDGFVGGQNTPDSLNYYDDTGQLALLWFNRKTNSAYISAPATTSSGSVVFTIKNAVNPYASERDTWTNTGYIDYTLFAGQYWDYTIVGFYEKLTGVLSMTSNAKWTDFIPSTSLVVVDSILSNQIDVLSIYSYAVGQSITMTFRITSSITQAEMKKRSIDNLTFDFTAGVLSIQKCYIQSEAQDSGVILYISADCSIEYSGTNYQIVLHNISDWDQSNAYRMFVQMTMSGGTITYNLNLNASNGEADESKTYSSTLTQFSNGHSIYNYLRFTEGKYTPGYFELYAKQLYSNTVTTQWRLRYRFTLDVAISYVSTTNYVDPMTNADYIKITLPASYYIQADLTQRLMCYFVPEISVYDQLSLPLYSKCSLDTSGSVPFFKLTAPRDALVAGQTYMLHIRESRSNEGQFTVPTTPTRSEHIWECYSPITSTSPSYDSMVTEISNLFSYAKINHLTTTSTDYDVAEITFIPTINLIDATETYIQVEIDSIYFQPTGTYQDFDIRNTYSIDGLDEFINGYTHSHLTEPAYSGGYTIINFGQHAKNFANIRIMLVAGQDLIAGQTYTYKIPMIRNQINQHTSISYKLSTILIRSKDQRVFTMDKFTFLNHAYIDPVHTDMTSANFKLLSSNDYVQQTTMDLAVMLNYNIAAPQRILLKWNNNFQGIVRSQLLNIAISGCKVEVFDKIYLIMITPQTLSSTAWTTLSLGTLFTTADCVKDYGFWYVYVCKNQLTEKYHEWTSNTLKALTTLSSASFTYIAGSQTINSVCKYLLSFVTPTKIPYGGYIEINLPTELDAYDNHCFALQTYTMVSTGTTTFQYGPLDCQKANSKKYILKGFKEITTATTLTLNLYLMNVAAGTSVSLASVSIYCADGSSVGSQTAIPSVLIKSTTPGMTRFDLIDQVTYPIYASEWQKLDFLFNVRVSDLTINSGYKIKLTLPTGWLRASGTNIVIAGRYKRSDPVSTIFSTYPAPPVVYKNWVTSKYSAETTKLVFDIDVDIPLLSHYTITKDVEYIFSIDSERSTVALQEGLYNVDRGLYAFYLETYSSTTLTEKTYNEFVVKPREDTADTFRVTVLNKGAGEKSIIRFDFTMNYSKAVAGDEIFIEFQTFDRLYNVFKNDLGIGFTDPISSVINCVEKSGYNKISASLIQCVVFRGDSSVLNPRGSPTYIRIPILKAIDTSETVSFYISNIENPLIVGQVAGIKLSVRRDCRDDYPQYDCILYHAEYQYKTVTPFAQTSYVNSGKFKAVSNVVTLVANHEFTLHPSILIQPTYSILITYPDNHKNENTCVSLVGTCIEFIENNWVLFLPNAVIQKNVNTTIELQNMINGWHRRSPSPYNYFLVKVFDASGNILEGYNITHDYYDYYMINTVGTILNTQTYDPLLTPTSLFLKEDYVNVAQIVVQNMDVVSEIQYYRLERPSQATQLIPNYCNATLTSLAANRKPYPLRFDCEVFTEYIMLNRTKYWEDWDSTFKTFDLVIYLKFIIDDQIPPLAGILPGPADPFILYGCVVRCDDLTTPDPLENHQYSHVSKSLIAWDVSEYQQPNLNTAGFYTESFYDRQASISEYVSLYMLIQPYASSCTITRFVFTIPDEFVYPQVLSFDSCTIQGVTSITVDACYLSRSGGETKVTIHVSSTINDAAKIFTISDSNGNNLFISPPYPGETYTIKLEIYCGSQLVETQYTNFSMISGVDLDVNYVKVINSLDSLTQQLYEVQFKTGIYVTPLGYQRTTAMTTSQINIVFEWIGDGYTIHPGYSIDLGLGQSEGSEVGCAIKSGLTLSSGKRLKCYLHLGTGPEDMPMIYVTNYEAIPASTLVSILLTQIESISVGLLTTVKVGVQTINPTTYEKAYFYNLMAYVPDATTALYNPLLTSTVLITVSGSSDVGGYSNYSFSFTLGTRSVSTTDYIGITLPSDFINTVNTGVSQPTCASSFCTAVYLFHASSMIYVQPATTLTAGSLISFQLLKVSNPSYAQQGTFTFSVFTFINRKIDRYYTASVALTFTASSLFTSALVEASSEVGGQDDVTYTFSFLLGHTVPENGAISIDFPTDLYSDAEVMAGSPLGCTMVGDPLDDEFNESTCSFTSSNRLTIKLSNTTLSLTTQYQIILEGITNPNILASSVTSPDFIFSSYFTNNTFSGQVISSTSADPPVYYITPVKTCTLEVASSIQNVNLDSLYTFTFICNTAIKNKSVLNIIFPIEYSATNALQTNTCKSGQSTTLYSSECILDAILGSLILKVTLRSIVYLESFSVSLTITNPSIANSAYAFSGEFYLYDSLYAETDNSGLNYVSVSDSVTLITISNTNANINVILQNVPTNLAEPASFIFQTPSFDTSSTSTSDAIDTWIYFPTQFSSTLGDNLECYIYQTDVSGVQFTIKSFLQAKASPLSSSYELYSVSCSIASDYTIKFSSVGTVYQQSSYEWNYLIVDNVINPGQFYLDYYTIIHSKSSLAFWTFTGQLYYVITESAKQLDIVSITPTVESSQTYSGYLIEVFTIYSLLSNINAGLLIELPDQFDQSLQPDSINCYSTINKAITVQCERYNQTILAWKEDGDTDGLLQFLYFEYLVNPSIENPCNDTTIDNPYFKVSIIDMTTNEILATQENQMIHSAVQNVTGAVECPTYVSNLYYIEVQGPSTLQVGLSYSFNMVIEAPADVLKLVAIYDDSSLILTPSVFVFEDFTLPAVIAFTVRVKSSATLNDTTITFTKTESRSGNLANAADQYQIPPIVTLSIVDNSDVLDTPYVEIGDIRAYTTGGNLTAVVTVSTPPAQNMYLTIVQSDTTSVTVNPTQLLITTNTTTLRFDLAYINSIIVSPITLTFTLTSTYTIYHELRPSVKYLILTQNNLYNGQLVTKLELIDNLPADSYYTPYIGDLTVPNSTNSTNLIPEILTIKIGDISDEQATLNIISSQPGEIKYLLCYKNSPLPSSSYLVYSSNYTAATVLQEGRIESTTMFLSAQDFTSELVLTDLTQQTSYDIFAICYNGLGQSEVFRFSFTTPYIQLGAILHLTLNQKVANSTILQEISQVLRISQSSMKISTAAKLVTGQLDRNKNDLYSYEIAFAPNTNGIDIADYLSSKMASSETLLSTYVTGFQSYRIEPMNRPYMIGSPMMVSLVPSLQSLGMYTATFAVQSWENSLVYGIALEIASSTSNLTVISQQIIMGVDQNNAEVNQLAKAQAYSDSNNSNIALVTFSNLKDGTQYRAFFTAAQVTAYPDSSNYIRQGDDEVISSDFTTGYNYNLNRCQMFNKVRALNRTLSGILESRFETDDVFGYCSQPL